MEKEILTHLYSEYPNEGCGIILNKLGKLRWIPCKNVSPKPHRSFKISTKEFTKATLQGDIHAIVHSHPNSSCEASEVDKNQSDYLQIPYIIYSLPSEEKSTYTPKYKEVQLLGREYKFNEQDCWTLVRDFYKQNFNIKLPMITFEEDFYNKGINYFEDLIEPWGGVKVDSPKYGDIIYFNVNSTIPNHCGIYIGNDNFIHARRKHLSCTDSLPRWQKYLTSYIRCKKFI